MRRLVLTVLLAAPLLAGCGALDGIIQSGLACSEPAGAPVEIQANPDDPGQPLAGKDVAAMTPAEVAAAGEAAGLQLTWRWMYGIAGGDEHDGYSECWCIPPPGGSVTGVAYDSVGRLVVFVSAHQDQPGVRAQPRMGWGCDEDGQPVRS